MSAIRFLSILVLMVLAGCGQQVTKQALPLSHLSDEAFLDSLQYYNFKYFLGELNPENGLVRDRTKSGAPSSIAAVGFAIPVWAIGAEKGWISREEALRYTLAAMNFFWHSPQSGTDPMASGHKGFYYHFLNMETGEREWACELSTIDTAWLIAGMRFAAQYFDRDHADEARVRALADSLTFRIDWDWTTAGSDHRSPGAVFMGWRPENGVGPAAWTGYNEALYLYVLAAGSGYRDARSAYQVWLDHYHWDEPYPEIGNLEHALFPPLFGHQYSHMFIDFRGIGDAYMREKGIDYFENSRRAVLAQQEYARRNIKGWKGYNELIWGLTACDGPGEKFNFDDKVFRTYSARGTSGEGENFKQTYFDDGTIAPTAPGASVPFAPEVTIPTLRAMYDQYGGKGLWGKYGFYDSFNPTLDWIDGDFLGIDQGPIVIMIENYKTGLIWKYCMKDPVIQKGLEILDFGPLK
ncbi:MAG TPA: glucoamylase family protein [Calditrichia bacterium]|nr:glucoamylase family protein [Calditrichia bacterium]HQV33999.1 glucoamylase family protein [Calditrichia bacterium]